MQTTISGRVNTWTLGRERKYSEHTLPFGEMSKYAMAVVYNAATNKGSQREVTPSHRKKLGKAMDEGRYTPTAFALSLSQGQRKNLKLDNGVYSLTIDENDPLHLTDGHHRFEELAMRANDLTQKLKAATGAEAEKLQKELDEVQSQPITAFLYLDGEEREDFVNLQLGRPADQSHLLSMRLLRGKESTPNQKLVFEVASLLHKDPMSPFHKQIRFDSKGLSPLPISTLCSQSASDVACSLFGLAKVGNICAFDAARLANVVTTGFQALEKHAPELLAPGLPLTPIDRGGKKGASTMLIGVSVVLAYRLAVNARSAPTDDEVEMFVEACKDVFKNPVNGNFSGPTKRKLLGEFAKIFLQDMEHEKHDEIPIYLLKTLSPSALAASKLPKPPKAAKPKKAAAATSEAVPSEASTTPVPSAEVKELLQEVTAVAPWDEDDEPAAETAAAVEVEA